MRQWQKSACLVAGGALIFACKSQQPLSTTKDVAFNASSPTAPVTTADTSSEISPDKTMNYHGLLLNEDTLAILSGNDRPEPISANSEQLASNGSPQGVSPQGDNAFGTSPQGGSSYPMGDPVAFGLAGGAKTAYMTNCEREGVPLPPAWGNAGWVKEGTLDKAKVFAGRGRTELWLARFTEGVCAALPRIDETTNEIQLFGVICANKTSGKTCFWDNRHPTKRNARGQQVAVEVKAGYEVSDGSGADQLDENCSTCHRGNNPWVVAPGEVTENLSAIVRRVYVPLGPAGWTNPTSKFDFKECTGCHRIPELSENYCRIANGMIARGVMPDGGGTDGVKTFQDECKRLFPPPAPAPAPAGP